MAVFTRISNQQATDWACNNFAASATCDFPLANVTDSESVTLSEISEGIENTNYLFTFNAESKMHRYVLTLFEVWDAPMVDYYAELMRHLSATAPVPAPLRPKNDEGKTLANKPCLLTPFIEGQSRMQPTADDCNKMGKVAAQLHLGAASFMQQMPNPRGNHWRRRAAKQILSQQNTPQQNLPPMSEDEINLLQECLSEDAKLVALPLPASPCHCDLFRNNVLWQDNQIAGVIDFYFGGDDTLIFDLAVCACDWCFDHASANDNNPNDFNTARLNALLEGYNSIRPFCDLEKQCFPQALQSAALRFWISRLHDLHFPREAHNLTPHNPRQFEDILRRARQIKNNPATAA